MTHNHRAHDFKKSLSVFAALLIMASVSSCRSANTQAIFSCGYYHVRISSMPTQGLELDDPDLKRFYIEVSVPQVHPNASAPGRLRVTASMPIINVYESTYHSEAELVLRRSGLSFNPGPIITSPAANMEDVNSLTWEHPIDNRFPYTGDYTPSSSNPYRFVSLSEIDIIVYDPSKDIEFNVAFLDKYLPKYWAERCSNMATRPIAIYPE